MGRNSKISKIYMHNGEWQQAAHTTSQLSSSSSTRALQKKAHLLTKNMLLYIPFTNCRLTAQAEAYKKAHLLRKNIGYFSGEKKEKKCQENGPLAEKWQKRED